MLQKTNFPETPADAHRPVRRGAGRGAQLVVLLAILSLALTSCSDDSVAVAPTQDPANAPPVDVATVLLSGPTIDEVTPFSARLTALSSLDLACAVSYGPTQDYGSIATDLDMAGGGHADHQPVLTGLKPDTVYHYRLGGMGPDGTVYRSRDLTFRTPAEEVGASAPEDGEDLALLSAGALVTGVSSNFGGGDNDSAWGANNAIDGDPSTQWSSNGDGDDAWLEIELPSTTHVTAIGFWTRTMGSSAEINAFEVVTEAGVTHGPFVLEDAFSTHRFVTDITARSLRFQATETSGGNTGAVEIQVFGQPVP